MKPQEDTTIRSTTEDANAKSAPERSSWVERAVDPTMAQRQRGSLPQTVPHRSDLSKDFDDLANAISLTEVPNHLPRRRGKKTHYSTVYRWATKGARGRILETKLVGGILYTTQGALQRFMHHRSKNKPTDDYHDSIERILADDRV
jgi:hypothetical protein